MDLENKNFYFIDEEGNIKRDHFRSDEDAHWRLIFFNNFFLNREYAVKAKRAIKKILKQLQKEYEFKKQKR